LQALQFSRIQFYCFRVRFILVHDKFELRNLLFRRSGVSAVGLQQKMEEKQTK
jgi:hypothetical protein